MARHFRFWHIITALASLMVTVLAGFIIILIQRDDKVAATLPSTASTGTPSLAGTAPAFTTPTPGPGRSINGNCNIEGNNNFVLCFYPPIDKSLGSISLHWIGAALFLFDGTSNELPRPPDYPVSKLNGHCDDWGSWLSKEPRIYLTNPTAIMGMQSGEPDLVVVQKIEVQVSRRIPISDDHVYVRCRYGAGGDAGHRITVNTRTNETLWENLDTTKTYRMPPASLSLKGRGYESTWIDIISSEGYLYEGVLTVSALINGEDRKILLGTPEQPYKWVGGNNFEGIPLKAYDWHPLQHRWILGNTPPCDIETGCTQ